MCVAYTRWRHRKVDIIKHTVHDVHMDKWRPGKHNHHHHHPLQVLEEKQTPAFKKLLYKQLLISQCQFVFFSFLLCLLHWL